MAFRAKGRSAGKVLLTLKKETHKKIIIFFFFAYETSPRAGVPSLQAMDWYWSGAC